MNNSAAVIIVGILGILTLGIGGKLLIDHNNNKVEQVAPVQAAAPAPVAEQPQQPPVQIVEVNPNPLYYSSRTYWIGYWDGYYGRPMQITLPEYNNGYLIGRQDRRFGNYRHYSHYCPRGIQLNILNMRHGSILHIGVGGGHHHDSHHDHHDSYGKDSHGHKDSNGKR